MQVLKKIADLTASQVSYIIALMHGHSWRCPWILEQEGYTAWINYEKAWGNPHPDYCNNWEDASTIMVKYGIFPEITDIARYDDGSVHFAKRFKARSPEQVLDCESGCYDDNPLMAVMLCYLTTTLGKVVAIPEEIP